MSPTPLPPVSSFSLSSFFPSYIDDAYGRCENASAMNEERSGTKQHRFDPYASAARRYLKCIPASSESTTVPSKRTTVTSTPVNTVVLTPLDTVASTAVDTVASTAVDKVASTSLNMVASTAVDTVAPAAPSTSAPAAVLKKGRKNPKDLIRPKEDYGIFNPDRILPEDHSLTGLRADNKKICWYFLLTLLMDPSNRHIVAWTGRGREFIIISPHLFLPMWGATQGFFHLKWDSFKRNLRTCYKKRILIPVDAKANRFAFHTEPSIHIHMTRGQLTDFIAAHSLAASPATAPVAQQGTVSGSMTYPTPPPSSTVTLDDRSSPIPPAPEYCIIRSSSPTVSLPDLTVSATHQPPACQFSPVIDHLYPQPTQFDSNMAPYWTPPLFMPNPYHYYVPDATNMYYYGGYYGT
ncbi:hypothetical protein PFISCL1PPCAC_3183 [Pristionchus fissidentatus]|uniref:ETS domain-containing protein n=1 Tax=Pristionchus fissidentatus TaxID=1538716 RepID=A0AAV5UZF3_9BILA|nr:hypothetical protein PFISCL1PPCAC_3183 [Pristionchus fissidentatus]